MIFFLLFLCQGKPCILAFGDKVVEYLGPREGSNWGLYQGHFIGKQALFEFAQLEFDPKYGEATSWNAMNAEMRAYYEDWLMLMGMSKILKVVGKLVEK